ncbi:MAG: ribbon-helix-helix protein, CopG family [Wenzhouxiangella sp.]|jgi:Arc/MetJ-type ribon-helix-helix transcriptional regulator|nr:ribbon-helix-helix protein, CopG family [Wenzhouxiangella sp.]
MPASTVKSTYSLDLATVRDLERLARRFGTSKSEVLRRAVRALAQQEPDLAAQSLQALNELQSKAELSEARARKWAAQVRDERIASERKRTHD